MFKEITIEGKKYRALLDTGSHLSLIREDVLALIKISELQKSEVLLTGIAQGRVKTLGHFQTIITIDNFDFPLTFHVVPTNVLNISVILGTDFVNQAEIRIDENGVTVNKPGVSIFLSQIELQPEENETGHTDVMMDQESKSIVEGMLLEYEPNKTKTTGIKLSIAVKDETPTHQAPRRLPPKEREIVEKQRSIGMTPFELLTGMKMKQKDDLVIKDALETEFQSLFEQGRHQLRDQAKDQILKVQNENRRIYNLRRRAPNRYKIGDIVAIKRVQLGPGKKLCAKYLGPYKIVKVKLNNNSYDVERIQSGEGPMKTSTCAEYMKPWSTAL